MGPSCREDKRKAQSQRRGQLRASDEVLSRVLLTVKIKGLDLL